ncbi:AAA family ATPase [Bifidobacterium moukalabense]|nr:ATP-binding protein [Bifidobacterium moukalabense]
MNLLRFSVEGVSIFENGTLTLDLYASDKVVKEEGLTHIGNAKSRIYTQNVIALAGINASGKTTSLRIIDLVTDIVNGDISGSSFRYGALLPVLQPNITVKAIFEASGVFYLLESHLTNRYPLKGGEMFETGMHDGRNMLAFASEALWEHRGTPTKMVLASFEAFQKDAELLRSRKSSESIEDLPEQGNQYLTDTISVTLPYVRNNVKGVNFGMISPVSQIMPDTVTSVLRTFDDSIVDYSLDHEENKAHLQFRDDDSERVLSPAMAFNMLSTGTKRGALMIDFATKVLQTGGYLVVDEIENSLNKQLVEVVIQLFLSSKTNPYGATLIFSTHYPEILDILTRKDNIYFMTRGRSVDARAEAVKYSTIDKRIENKRSEVFESNFVKGTAPKYADVQALRRYIIGQLEGDGDVH